MSMKTLWIIIALVVIFGLLLYVWVTYLAAMIFWYEWSIWHAVFLMLVSAILRWIFAKGE